MPDPIAAWHTEHVFFNQLLGMLQKQLDKFHRGDHPNYDLMLDIVSYLRDYSDTFHHPPEDVAFARLAEKCPDMELMLARLEQEHRVIAHAGEVLRKLIQGVVDGSVIPRAEVEVAAATYLVYYGNHIAKEEEDVLTRAAGAAQQGRLGKGSLWRTRVHENLGVRRLAIALASHIKLRQSRKAAPRPAPYTNLWQPNLSTPAGPPWMIGTSGRAIQKHRAKGPLHISLRQRHRVQAVLLKYEGGKPALSLVMERAYSPS